MGARSIDEPHRASSELELLFDLTFVVAVGVLTSQSENSIANGHPAHAVLPFLQVFFAIWWAWMNFTWFASSYGIDDVAYRLLTMVQMGGVIVLAAGIPAAVARSSYATVALGYLIMRVGLALLWLRAGIQDPSGRRTAFRYACGISILQLAWLTRFVLFEHRALPSYLNLLVFTSLAALELAVPRWAERTGPTTWHPHHIAERYGLFTIILLGDNVLALSSGLQHALATARVTGQLVGVAAAGFALLCALWWLYFLQPAGEGLAARRHRSYVWGYGHFGLFASLAAVGSGLRVAIEQTAHPHGISALGAGWVLALPAALFILLLWLVQGSIVSKPAPGPGATLTGVAAALTAPLAATQIGLPVVVAAIAGVLALLIASTLFRVVESRACGSSTATTGRSASQF